MILCAQEPSDVGKDSQLMWSLSLPQGAATLAAALVAFNAFNQQGQRLIDEPILNTIIVLMVVTSILGPVLTERISVLIVQRDRTAKGGSKA